MTMILELVDLLFGNLRIPDPFVSVFQSHGPIDYDDGCFLATTKMREDRQGSFPKARDQVKKLSFQVCPLSLQSS